LKKHCRHRKAYNQEYQDWIPDRAYSYMPNDSKYLNSRLYGVIGADNSGKSFVKFRGFGPEYQELIRQLVKDNIVEIIGTDVVIYPKQGSALELMKKAANIGRTLGFQYGAEVRFRAINRAIDPFSDGTLMGSVPKNKIANKLYRQGLIAGRLFIASTAEKEFEKVAREIIPGSPFEGRVFIVGGYVRDELLAQMFPGKVEAPKDLDAVVEMPNGAKLLSEYLYGKLKNSKGTRATHSPHELGAGYPIWQLSFLDGEEGNVKLGDKVFATSGAVIEFADTQKEAFPDPKSRQRVTTFGTLEEDVKRRDFTVNMLLKDLSTGEIKDLTGTSKKDIKEGVLKGHPEVDLNKIFADDPLRMVRLVRFKVKYDWDVPEDVKQIVRKNAYRLNIVSAERLRDELIKVMQYGKLREAIRLMKDVGFDKIETKEELNPVSYLLEQLKPMEMRHESPHHIDTEEAKDDKIIDHTLNVIGRSKNTVNAQLAALLHDIGKPKARAVKDGKVQFKKHELAGLDIAEDILRRFKFDSVTIKKVLRLIKSHMRPHSLEGASDKAIRKLIRDMGEDLDDVLDLAQADSEGKNPPQPYVDELRKRIKELKNTEMSPTGKVKPVLNGKEIMETLNIKSGPIIGKVVEFLLDMQDENPKLTKEEAKKAILKKFSP